ncbi:MAG: hypothetical protein PWR28_1103 [Synergistaceae bacterium]|nr:hypothetical protein [Synergistaceae bacterium]
MTILKRITDSPCNALGPEKEGLEELSIGFFAYKLLGAVITPPGVIILLLFVLGAALFRRPRRPVAGSLLLLCAAALYVMSTGVGTRYIAAPWEQGIRPSLPEEEENAVVLVLSGGMWRGSTPDQFDLSPHGLQRIVGAWEVASRHGWPLMLSGGLPRGGGISEAEAMARKVALWKPRVPTIVENKSRTTWENVEIASDRLKEMGYRNAVLVTSAYHMRRALWMATRKMEGIAIYPYPVGYLADQCPLEAIDFLPSASDLELSFLTIREAIGLLGYSLLRLF